MAVYYYTARTGDGAALSGSLDATTRDEAVGHLRSRSLFVTSVETGETTRGMLAQMFLYAAHGAHRRAAFFRSFATLVGAGVPLRRALETVLVDCRDRVFAETVRSVIADVDRGVALSTAASRHPREFTRVALAMIGQEKRAVRLTPRSFKSPSWKSARARYANGWAPPWPIQRS